MLANRNFYRLCRLSKELIPSSHPSLRCAPPRSSFASNTARNLSIRADLPGVSALFTTSPVCVHSYGELPTLRFVSSSGYLNLATLYSASWLAVLFQPAAVFRTHPVQGLLSPRGGEFFSEFPAPVPLSASSSSVARCPLDRRLGFEASFCAKQRFFRRIF